MGVRIEMLWEVYRITERRQGCVFKTEHVEYRWLPAGSNVRQTTPDGDPDLQWGSVSDRSVKDTRTVIFQPCPLCPPEGNFHTLEEHDYA
jgi:hypothetical protein